MSLDILNPTVPKLCPEHFTKFPPVPCRPFEWMKGNMESGLITDIDGFVVNFRDEVVTSLIQRREYEPRDYNSVLEGNEVLNSIFQRESIEEWKLRYVLSEMLKVPLFLALWSRDYPTSTPSEISKPVIVYEIKQKNGQFALKEEFVGNTKDFQDFIKKLRGMSFAYVKNLSVAMTMMECFLANRTGDPFPGNIDSIIWDKDKKRVAAIVEFKTHNYSNYPISSQYFGQWGAEDTRRYKVLDILQKHLEKASSKPKFVFVIWGTDKTHKEIKLQTIDNLVSSNTKLINRPEFTNATTEEFTKEVLDYIYT